MNMQTTTVPKKKQQGFTIIEVLIVLAIAGLILMIVFLAVPSLQRNSRNTQRRNDVSKMVGVLSEAANNNNGRLCTGAGPCPAPAVLTNERYSQYEGATGINMSIVTTGGAAGYVPPTVNLTTVFIRNNLKCSGNAPAGAPGAGTAPLSTGTTANDITTTAGATLRTVVAVFGVEQQNGTVQAQCVDS